jgi:UDP-N-acetyl-D-mannosaminuronic acid dehydrogenase
MKICVVGLGYIGLPTALLLAKAGHRVIGYDVVKHKVDQINAGQLPFKELGLDVLFSQARPRFTAVCCLNDQLAHDVDAYVVAVPTPVTENHGCGLQYVESAMRTVAQVLRPHALVILESTVRPGTLLDVVVPILEGSGMKAGEDFSVAFVAEKAIPGNTLYEAVHNDRIIGGIDKRSSQIASKIYASFVTGTIHVTDPTTAETVKLVENAYRDINIAYANELSLICQDLNIDVWEVIALANRHPRVQVHSPGPGVGGHCIPLDPWFLMSKTPSLLIKNARAVNDGMPTMVFGKLQQIAAAHGIDAPTIGVLGVAYKRNVDDARDTPAATLLCECQRAGWNVIAHDPLVEGFCFPLTRNLDDVLEADLLVLVTDHDVYKDVDFSESIVLDTRNMGLRAKFYYLFGRD